MPADIEALIEILDHSEQGYRRLLAVLQEEKQAALSSTPDRLSTIIEEKAILMAELGRTERKRQLLLHGISAAWKIPAEHLRLSMLADKANAAQASKIEQLSVSLRDLVTRTKKANDENRLLVRHCLRIVNSAIGFFKHWVLPTDVYGASGRLTAHNNSGKLVSGAV